MTEHFMQGQGPVNLSMKRANQNNIIFRLNKKLLLSVEKYDNTHMLR
jgi:hypothetical protein